MKLLLGIIISLIGGVLVLFFARKSAKRIAQRKLGTGPIQKNQEKTDEPVEVKKF